MDLGLSWIEWLWFPQGAPLILLTVVLFYASPGHSDSVPHLGFHGPRTLVLTQASLGPGYSIPHLSLTYPGTSGPILGLKLNWLLGSPSGPHPYLVTLVTPWASLGPAASGR